MKRSLQAVFAGLGLLTLGLWIGGATGRVHALVRAAASSPHISPIAGSRAALAREVVLDGQPARLRRCIAPASWSVAQVREHFENIADAESRFASGERVPFLAIDQFEGASVVWTSVADGRRKGVIIQRNAGAVEYTLLDSEALEVPTASTGGSSSSVLLPGGAKAPAGSRAGLSIVDGASSFSFFDAPGSPDTVADELKKSLAGAGYEVDAKHEEAIEETTRLRGSSSRVVVPFKGKENKGFLIVAPQGAGSSRATVVVR